VAGGSFEEFFGKYVAGTDPFPYQQILGLAGLILRTVERRRPVLGFFVEHELNGPFVVGTVDSESAAALAGLRAGDVLLNWNGGEVPKRVDRWLQEQRPGDSLKLKVRREDKEITLEFRLGEIKETLYQVIEDSHAGEKARHIREGMLRGETSAVTAVR
jgi:predicted metalloprotease with PDZ domain